MSRITRALLALALLALAAPASAPPRRRSCRSGLRHADLRRPRRRSDTQRAVRRRARRRASGSCATARRWRPRSSTSRPTWRPTASAACSRWRSPPTTSSRACSTSTWSPATRSARSRCASTGARPRNPTSPTRPGGIVWRATHNEAANHNGGQIAWGPDGLLWFATGDGGGGNDQFDHARDLVEPARQGAADRPAPRQRRQLHGPGRTTRYGTAVWAYGLRNPFRFSFDRATGDLLIGDVGQGPREEIDWARAADGRGRGADYGWACREGTVAGPGACAAERRLHRRRCSTTTSAPAARGHRRLRRARPRPADAARPLRLRGHVRRRRALARARRSRAPTDDRPDRAAGARPDRLLRRGRLRPPLRRLARRQRRAHPGRRARARAVLKPRRPPLPSRPAPRPPVPARSPTAPRRASASASRARAAWAAARRRGSCSRRPRTAA